MLGAISLVCFVMLLALIVAVSLRLRAKRRQPWPGPEELSDDEVIAAIRSVPMHFTQQFWGGQGGIVSFTPTGGALMSVANKSWKFKRKNNTNKVTNAGSSSQTQKIAGVNEQDGSFEVFWDSSLPPDTNGLYAGNTGVLVQRYGSSGHEWTQTVIIEDIEDALDAQEGAIMYTVTYSGIAAPVYT